MSAIDDNPFSKELEGCIEDDDEIFSKKPKQAKGTKEL
jgi:hypothetical protein